MPQALTHGTLECDDKEASAAFYRDVLGLEIAGGGRISVYIKHRATPWYIVMWLEHGTAYLVGFFVGDNFERFATDRFNEPRPWWFYLPIMAGGLLPWTALMTTSLISTE